MVLRVVLLPRKVLAVAPHRVLPELAVSQVDTL